MPFNVIHNEKTHNTCNDIIRKMRNISSSNPKRGLFVFILSIFEYFGVIYLRISGLEAFSFVANYPLKYIVYYGRMVLCIIIRILYIIWFMCYAFMYYACHYVVSILCDAVSRNHPVKQNFGAGISRIKIFVSHLKISDSRFYPPTHDS